MMPSSRRRLPPPRASRRLAIRPGNAQGVGHASEAGPSRRCRGHRVVRNRPHRPLRDFARPPRRDRERGGTGPARERRVRPEGVAAHRGRIAANVGAAGHRAVAARVSTSADDGAPSRGGTADCHRPAAGLVTLATAGPCVGVFRLDARRNGIRIDASAGGKRAGRPHPAAGRRSADAAGESVAEDNSADRHRAAIFRTSRLDVATLATPDGGHARSTGDHATKRPAGQPAWSGFEADRDAAPSGRGSGCRGFPPNPNLIEPDVDRSPYSHF